MNLPDNLPQILRKHGLEVEEVPGWRDRGRPPSTGGFAPVGGLCHDTVTSKATSDAAVIKLLVDGRSDLPGPLAQLGLNRAGKVFIVAAGRCNHAGVAKPSGTVAGGDGNELYIGTEAFNAGTGEPWTQEQYDAYVLLEAVLSHEITGNSPKTVRGHKETSVTGKIDPFGPTPFGPTFDMDVFRGRVAKELAALDGKPKPPTPNPPPPPFWSPHRRVQFLRNASARQLARGHKARADQLERWADKLAARIKVNK